MLDREAIQRIIPHRDPFLFIDRIVEFEQGLRCVAEHTFTGEEWYLRGHFPGNPIVPGVILVESCAQAATVLGLTFPEAVGGIGLFAGIDEMRFKRIVRPGDTARFEAKVDRQRRMFIRMAVRATVGGEVAAEGVISAIFTPKALAATK